MKENEMEFINEIATQLTELNFREDTFERPTNSEGDAFLDTDELHFTKDAQEFYNERYDEVESLYINLITKTK